MQTGIQLKVINLLKNYIASNKLISIAIIYFVLSIILKIIFNIDILIPCLWKSIFHSNCHGCGLTTAFIKILFFDIKGAYYANPLIFIALPLVIFSIFNDFLKFKKEQQTIFH